MQHEIEMGVEMTGARRGLVRGWVTGGVLWMCRRRGGRRSTRVIYVRTDV
jgi:hypothetical protein